MALTPSKMLPLGTLAPDFSLPDTVSGKTLSLQELRSDKATVVMFLCNHCPYVVHLHPALPTFVKTYQAQGVAFIGISSNDVSRYPADSPELMTELAQRENYSFPYLFDESQEVARAYDAACTPDFYVFDGNLRLAYRGRFDESRPNSGKPVIGTDLAAALEAILAGKPVDEQQYPSMGCNIKWKEA